MTVNVVQCIHHVHLVTSATCFLHKPYERHGMKMMKENQNTCKENSPAIQAVMKHATVPDIKALMATSAKSPFLSGAIGVRPPNWIPIAPTLAKPQSAYVAIISERNCKSKSNYSKMLFRTRKLDQARGSRWTLK